MLIRRLIGKHLSYFTFFYSYLKWRVFLSLFFSFLTGLLDGIGLALFLPLLQIIFNHNQESGTGGDFLNKIFFDWLGLEPNVLVVFTMIFILFSLKGIIKFFDSFFKVLWQQKMMRKIRFNSLSLFSNYEFSSFVSLDAGRVQNTLGADVAQISVAYRFYFKTINFSVLVLAYLLLSFGVEWIFTTLVLLGGLLISFFAKILFKKTKYFSAKLVSENNDYHKLLLEKINLYKYLKATGLNKSYLNKLFQSIFKMDKIQRRLGIVDAALIGLREPLIIIVIFGAIFLYIQIFDQAISSVLLSLVLIYRAFSFFMASQEQWNLFLSYSGSLDNLKNFNELLNKNQEESSGELINEFKKSLSLNNISFKYKSNQENTLKNISIEVEKNSSLAIVGPSGSGKTTLMNILNGLLVPTEGDIYIDGLHFSQIDSYSFRSLLGYIVQDATIFNDTVFNNVSFWDEKNEANIAKFQDAIKKANIYEFISGLDQKEDTLLGMNGVNLSGGQKQRISIARELYKEARIFFMDEATSSLDSETELEIQKNILALKGDYTFITIAHRLNTIKNADKIILLENGEIQAIGTYNDLLETSESFQRMIELQEL